MKIHVSFDFCIEFERSGGQLQMTEFELVPRSNGVCDLLISHLIFRLLRFGAIEPFVMLWRSSAGQTLNLHTSICKSRSRRATVGIPKGRASKNRCRIPVCIFFTHAPLGRWVLKYRSFFFLFFSVENVRFNWIFGNTWCVFLSRANSTARCRRCFVAEFFQVYIVFLVVAIFSKTECYSPSNLLVRSAMCRPSAVVVVV